DSNAELDEILFLNLTSPTALTFGTNSVIGLIRDDDFRATTSATPGAPLSFVTIANRYHRVQRTLSLTPPVEWTTVPGAEALLGNGGTVQITDPSTTNEPQRFYRIRLLP